MNAIQALSQLSYTPTGKVYHIRKRHECQERFCISAKKSARRFGRRAEDFFRIVCAPARSRLAVAADDVRDGGGQLLVPVGVEMLAVERFDLVVLDLNLPGEDGMTVLRTLRERDRDTKVLILSARCEVADKVAGLDAGANDYLTKPFHLDELAARIRSLTLRRFTQSDVVLTCAELSFDTKARTASVRGETLSLTRKETGILEYLLLHQGRPVSQEELLEHVWDSGADGFGNSIRVHISALRKKLRAALGYDPIRNRIGEGYLMGGEVE